MIIDNLFSPWQETGSVQLNELLDPKSAYDLTWSTDSGLTAQAQAQTQDGRTITIEIDSDIRLDLLVIKFDVGGEFQLTGGGDQFRILSTVIAAVQHEIRRWDPKYLVFLGDKEHQPLYHAIARRFQAQWELIPIESASGMFKFYLGQLANDTVFILQNKRPDDDDDLDEGQLDKFAKRGVAEGTVPANNHRGQSTGADIEVTGINIKKQIFKITYNGTPYTVQIENFSKEKFKHWTIAEYDVTIRDGRGKDIFNSMAEDAWHAMADTIIAYLDLNYSKEEQQMVAVNRDQDDQLIRDLAPHKLTPVPGILYMAFSYSREGNTEMIPGMNIPKVKKDELDKVLKKIKFKFDHIEDEVMAIAGEYGLAEPDQGAGFGAREMFWDRAVNYADKKSVQVLATNILKAHAAIDKHLTDFNNTLQKIGLPGIEWTVWEGAQQDRLVPQQEDYFSTKQGFAKIADGTMDIYQLVGKRGVAEGSSEETLTTNVVKQWEKMHRPDAEQQAAKDAWVAKAAKTLTQPKKKMPKKGVAEDKINETVTVRRFTNRAGQSFFIAQTTMGREEVKMKGDTADEAKDNLEAEIRRRQAEQTKVTSNTVNIDFNAPFAQSVSKNSLDSFWAKIQKNERGTLQLVVANPQLVKEFGADLAELGFMRSGVRVQSGERAGTVFPSLTLNPNQIQGLDLVANGRYVLTNWDRPGTDRDQNTVFDLRYDSTASSTGDKVRLREPAFTVAVPRARAAKGVAEETQGQCPPATQDITLNLKNRQKAIDEYGYGPLNPDLPNDKFWTAKVKEWNLDSAEEAKQSLCGNCAAFDQRAKTLDCIAQGIDRDDPQDAAGTIDAGDLGYCKFLKFKCASRRTCDAWVTGGPLTDHTDNAQSQLEEKWSNKYKRSINCDHPRGFSQRAHCAGRKKNEDHEAGEQRWVLYLNSKPASHYSNKSDAQRDAEAVTQRLQSQGQSVPKIEILPHQRGLLEGQDVDLLEVAQVMTECLQRDTQQALPALQTYMRRRWGLVSDPDQCLVQAGELLSEDLRKWFREKWVRFNPQGKIMGPCARGSSQEGKPKCLPQSKAHSLGKRGRASAAARKRREDPNPERRGAARNVATKKKSVAERCWDGYRRASTKRKGSKQVPNCVPVSEQRCPHCGGAMVNDLVLAEKQDACYHKVRSRYKVWPSAYASGALVQCRKRGAANWGNKSK